MKRKEWMIIAGVGLVTAIFSIIISGALFGSPKKNPIKVPVVDKISSSFPDPQNDQQYAKFYNKNAFDPTQLIQIGNNNNSTPFQNAQ